MKLAKWILIPGDKQFQVYRNGSVLTNINQKRIISEDNISLILGYDKSYRLESYTLEYQNVLAKFNTFNSVFITFKDIEDDQTPEFDLMYEDQIIRLIKFRFETHCDYLLVGRWREVETQKEDLDE